MSGTVGRGVMGAAAVALLVGCSPGVEAPEECRIVQELTELPDGLHESSGVAVSRAHDGVIWTHNDSGGDPEVFAVRAGGELVGRVAIEGARARDWEDMALAPCPAGTCLYIADVGDNNARRQEIGVYRVPEPDPGSERSLPAEYFPARYPDGPRDAEAVFVTSDSGVHLITKGRDGPVELFRYPQPLQPGETVTLEPIRTLAVGPQSLAEQVTGASASPSGQHVAIRSYKRLRIWRTDVLLSGEGEPVLSVDLTPVGEAQGEAVALLDGGSVVLTTEGGFPGANGMIAMLACGI